MIETGATIGLVALGVYLTYKLVKGVGSLVPTHDPNAGLQPPTQLPAPVAQQVQHITVPPTLTQEQAGVIVDQIYDALYGSGTFWTGILWEDEDQVIEAMERAQNDADVVLIAQLYGIRGSYASFRGDMGLYGAIETYLSDADRAKINAYYEAHGITIRV